MVERAPAGRRLSGLWLGASCVMIACFAGLFIGRPRSNAPAPPRASAPETMVNPRERNAGTAHSLVACSTGSDHSTGAVRPAATSLPAIRASTSIWLDTPEQKAALDDIIAFLPHMNSTDVLRPQYFCPADFNRDNLIDATDESLFLQAWSDPSHPLAGWADLTDDGVLDEADLDEFVRRTQAADCDPAATAERRQFVC